MKGITECFPLDYMLCICSPTSQSGSCDNACFSVSPIWHVLPICLSSCPHSYVRLTFPTASISIQDIPGHLTWTFTTYIASTPLTTQVNVRSTKHSATSKERRLRNFSGCCTRTWLRISWCYAKRIPKWSLRAVSTRHTIPKAIHFSPTPEHLGLCLVGHVRCQSVRYPKRLAHRIRVPKRKLHPHLKTRFRNFCSPCIFGLLAAAAAKRVSASGTFLLFSSARQQNVAESRHGHHSVLYKGKLHQHTCRAIISNLVNSMEFRLNTIWSGMA